MLRNFANGSATGWDSDKPRRTSFSARRGYLKPQRKRTFTRPYIAKIARNVVNQQLAPRIIDLQQSGTLTLANISPYGTVLFQPIPTEGSDIVSRTTDRIRVHAFEFTVLIGLNAAANTDTIKCSLVRVARPNISNAFTYGGNYPIYNVLGGFPVGAYIEQDQATGNIRELFTSTKTLNDTVNDAQNQLTFKYKHTFRTPLIQDYDGDTGTWQDLLANLFIVCLCGSQLANASAYEYSSRLYFTCA